MQPTHKIVAAQMGMPVVMIPRPPYLFRRGDVVADLDGAVAWSEAASE
jgi:precorrin-6x reductase